MDDVVDVRRGQVVPERSALEHGVPAAPDFDARDPPGDRRNGAGEGGRRLQTGREVGGAVQEQDVAPCELGGRLAGREPGRETDDGA